MPKAEFAMTPEQLSELPWKEVTSSNIHALAFHEGGLFIRFNGGEAYRYEVGEGERPPSAAQTTEELYTELLEADSTPNASVGKTFHSQVKGRVHEARVKIDDSL